MPTKIPARVFLMSVSLACLAGTPAMSQDAPPVPTQQQSEPSADTAAAPCEAPKKKKKKGFGLGGLLRAARASGLTNLAGSGTFGKGAAVASAAAGTAAGLSDAVGASTAEQQASAC
jgi:hypothetical protein